MKRVDLWLDNPVDLNGEGINVYPEVVHIDTTQPGCEYVEDVYQEILYLDEMDPVMRSAAIDLLE
jgi:hypothetical protein